MTDPEQKDGAALTRRDLLLGAAVAGGAALVGLPAVARSQAQALAP